MKICKSFEEISLCGDFREKSIGVTIGNFDGVHLGHQYLIKTIRDIVSKDGIIFLITFYNNFDGKFLYEVSRKLQLLELCGVDMVLLLSFDEICNLSYIDFLDRLSLHLPISFLVLGKGACFGKDNYGDECSVKSVSSRFFFKSFYIDKMRLENFDVSSTDIRDLIKGGNFDLAERMLTRKFSISGYLNKSREKAEICYIDASEFCLPKDGIYDGFISMEKFSVRVCNKSKSLILLLSMGVEKFLGKFINIIFG